MQKAVGSSPIARSNPPFPVNVKTARYPSGKGEVCKTSIRRFESGPRLPFSVFIDTPIQSAYYHFA
jgi:hypothetical protein